jgi:hypothetical protein
VEAERKMPTERSMESSSRGILVGVLFGAGVCGLFAGCSIIPPPPTYTEAEFQAACERRGGWWRGTLIPGYREYELALRIQAP